MYVLFSRIEFSLACCDPFRRFSNRRIALVSSMWSLAKQRSPKLEIRANDNRLQSWKVIVSFLEANKLHLTIRFFGVPWKMQLLNLIRHGSSFGELHASRQPECFLGVSRSRGTGIAIGKKHERKHERVPCNRSFSYPITKFHRCKPLLSRPLLNRLPRVVLCIWIDGATRCGAVVCLQVGNAIRHLRYSVSSIEAPIVV